MKLSPSFKVGILTIVALTIFLFTVLWVKGRSFSSAERIEVQFKDVNGIRPGSGVQMMGLRVGQVEDIIPVVENESSYVKMRFVITEPGITIPKASMLSIQQSGLIGEQFLEITPPRIRSVYIPVIGNEMLVTDSNVEIKLDEKYYDVGKVKKSQIDIVEFRGDYYNYLNDFDKLCYVLKYLKKVLSDIILLFTIRSNNEGGEKLSFSSPEIFEINEYVIANELADMVDVELNSGTEIVERQVSLARNHNIKVIISNHDFNTTPSRDEILKRLCLMQDIGADIAKIAVMPKNKKQVMELLMATLDMEECARIPIVTISMGEIGLISRMCGQFTGSAITFATVCEASAPGQIPVSELQETLGIFDKYCNK